MLEIFRFKSKVTEADLIKFRKTFLKAQGQGKVLYIMIVMFFAFALYQSITLKDYSILVLFTSIIVICLASYFVSYYLKPTVEAKNLFKNDYTYNCENEIIIFDDHIETNLKDENNDFNKFSYYPFSMINAVIEDSKTLYLQFNLSEVRIINKNDIPNDKLSQVKNILEENCGKIKVVR